MTLDSFRTAIKNVDFNAKLEDVYNELYGIVNDWDCENNGNILGVFNAYEFITTDGVADMLQNFGTDIQGAYDLLAELLSICEKREWTADTIRGCSQSEWQTIIYPVDSYTDEFINYIESIYFNTGDEYAIATVDDDDTADSPLECDDVYYNYYPSDVTWNDDLLKKAISDETGEPIENIILYEWHSCTSDVWNVA